MTDLPEQEDARQAKRVMRRNKVAKQAQDHFCWQLKQRGFTHAQIAQEATSHFAMPFGPQAVSAALRREGEREVRRGVHDRTIARQLALDELQTLRRAALDVLGRPHFVISRGEIVRDEHGTPLLDDGPSLAAIDRVIKIQERHARLEGLDAPAKVDYTTSAVQPDPVVFDIIRAARERLAVAGQSPTPTGSASLDTSLAEASRLSDADIEDAVVVDEVNDDDDDFPEPADYFLPSSSDPDDATVLTFPSPLRAVPDPPPLPPVF